MSQKGPPAELSWRAKGMETGKRRLGSFSGKKAMKYLNRFSTIAALSLFCVAGLSAQAPPGPITPPPDAVPSGPSTPPPPKIAPRKNILGAWRLNRDESDDPRQRSNQRKANDPNSNHGGVGGPHIGFPGGTIGGPGAGGGQPGHGSKDTDEDKERYRELVDPSVRLRMERKGDKDPVVTMFGDQGRKTIFYTDGHKPDTAVGAGTDVVEARWDDGKLVSESQLPKKGSMRRTYEVSEDGMQLFEEVELVTGKDKNPSKFRFVYDAVANENY